MVLALLLYRFNVLPTLRCTTATAWMILLLPAFVNVLPRTVMLSASTPVVPAIAPVVASLLGWTFNPAVYCNPGANVTSLYVNVLFSTTVLRVAGKYVASAERPPFSTNPPIPPMRRNVLLLIVPSTMPITAPAWFEYMSAPGLMSWMVLPLKTLPVYSDGRFTPLRLLPITLLVKVAPTMRVCNCA